MRERETEPSFSRCSALFCCFAFASCFFLPELRSLLRRSKVDDDAFFQTFNDDARLTILSVRSRSCSRMQHKKNFFLTFSKISKLQVDGKNALRIPFFAFHLLHNNCCPGCLFIPSMAWCELFRSDNNFSSRFLLLSIFSEHRRHNKSEVFGITFEVLENTTLKPTCVPRSLTNENPEN